MVDAEGAVLGRLASSIAARLRGKSNPLFTPHVDTGDWIVVINADKIVLTGKKWDKKNYYRHSGYTGGLKTTSAKELLEKRPTDSLRLQSKGCCPRTLGRKLFKN
jgi:large subunit ribosomal protein L13